MGERKGMGESVRDREKYREKERERERLCVIESRRDRVSEKGGGG